MSSPIACPTMPGFPSTSLIALLSASSDSYRIPCSLNHAMASTYDIRLNGRWGTVNLELPKLTIAAVVWLARMATDSHICRSLDQRNMRKIIVIRRLTSMWFIRSSIVVNANSTSSCVCSLRWRRVGLFSAETFFCAWNTESRETRSAIRVRTLREVRGWS